MAIAGGGKLESESGFGRQDSIGAAIEGGGHIDIRSIDAEHVDAAVDGGGHIALRAERRILAAPQKMFVFRQASRPRKFRPGQQLGQNGVLKTGRKSTCFQPI